MKRSWSICNQTRHSGRCGFTLLELLVAASLMVVVVGMIVMLLSSILTQWNRSAARMATDQQASAVLDLLEHDLSSPYFRRDDGPWLIYEERASVDGSRPGFWLGCFVDTPTLPHAHALQVVGYWTDELNPIKPLSAEGKLPVMLRAMVSAEETYRAFLVDKSRLLANEFPTTIIEAEEYGDAVVCSNLIAASLRFTSPDALQPITGSRIEFPYTTEDGHRIPCPIAVDIELVFLDDEGIHSAEAVKLGEIPKDRMQQIIAAHAHHYTRKVRILSNP